MKLLALFLAIVLPLSAHAQTRAVTINPSTNALITPSASDFRAANSLADSTALNASNLTTGTVPALRLPANLQSFNSLSGSGFPAFLAGTSVLRTLQSSGSGISWAQGANGNADPTIALHATLQALAANTTTSLTLTNITPTFAGLSTTPLNASNLSSGTVSTARYPTYRVNVKDYGAVGSGAVDDSTAIQSAITAVAGVSGEVYFPPGIYKCNLVLPASVSLVGPVDSSDAEVTDTWRAILKPNTTSSPVIGVPDSHGVRIANLALFGPGAYVAGSTGIRVALTTSGGRQFFNGSSTSIDGVLCLGFEAGLFAATYRMDVRQSAFRDCKFGVFLNNTTSGLAEHTPGVGNFPSDHLTFVNCNISGSMQVSAGVHESHPYTNYGLYANSVRCLTVIGGDIGGCGVGIYLEGVVASLNCHIESTDSVGLRVYGGDVHLSAVNTLNMGGILTEGSGSLKISTLSLNSSSYASGPAFIGMLGENMNVKSDPELIVKHMTSGGTLIGYGMTSGSRVATYLNPAQTINPGNVATEVLWTGVDTLIADGVEGGANSNYDAGTGRWTCPKARSFRFDFQLDRYDAAAGRWFTLLQERNGAGVIQRDFRVNTYEGPGTDGNLLKGSIVLRCTAGYKYSVAAYSESATSVTVGGGTSPTSGSPTSLFTITPL